MYFINGKAYNPPTFDVLEALLTGKATDELTSENTFYQLPRNKVIQVEFDGASIGGEVSCSTHLCHCI